MTIRKIFTFPKPILRVKGLQVSSFDEKLATLAADMAETMYDAPGIGLAAPQIGKSLRLIVVDISKNEDEDDEEEKKEYLAMINPEIVEKEGAQVDEEGCLSLLDLTADVQRFQKVKVKYQDLAGEAMELEAEDRFAVVLQHEIDHLNGILFLDYLSTLKRTLYKKKIKKMLDAQKDQG